MKNIFGKALLMAAMAVFGLTSCSDDETVPQTEPTYNMAGFAKGADVSWLTQMEASGTKFYDKNGSEKESMSLLREMGTNSIRLRIWVNPADGWCGKDDLIAKAWRAKNLGYRLMVDFHYSDSWADPGKQPIPEAWKDHDIEAMKKAVADHTTDVLQTLKDRGIDVEWVQVGNETNTGMLWPVGQVVENDFTNFASLVTSGYDAAKAVYPDAKVVVHLSNGYDNSLFRWMFDGLTAKGAKFDTIGVSLYPEDSDWEEKTDQCLTNLKDMANRYGKEVMVCEFGMNWDSANSAAFATRLVEGCKGIDKCLGVFYWEPQCYNGWNGYTKGAFDDNGRPTSALDIYSK